MEVSAAKIPTPVTKTRTLSSFFSPAATPVDAPRPKRQDLGQADVPAQTAKRACTDLAAPNRVDAVTTLASFGVGESVDGKQPTVDLQCPGPRDSSDFLFGVISKGRPKNVGPIEALFNGTGLQPVWIVGEGEASIYRAAGQELDPPRTIRVIEGGKLCPSRNKAIDLAAEENKICVEISDDISEVKFLESDEWSEYTRAVDQTDANRRAKEATCFVLDVVQGARVVESMMRKVGAKLGGQYVCGNSGLAYNSPPRSRKNFIVGDFIVVDPTSPCRFDEEMILKEDYDFTAQHISQHGVICRVNRLFVKAVHYSNEGGAVAVRNTEREQAMIAHLRKKWGAAVFVNQRRENEVTMKAEKVKRVRAPGSSSFEVCADCGASYAAAFAWSHNCK